MGKYISELSALNAEARERHISYGQLMARTTPQEREKIIRAWRNRIASNDDEEPEQEKASPTYTLSQFQLNHAEEWLELYNKGLTDVEIANRTGVSVTPVRTWRLAFGMKANTKTQKRKSHDDEFMPLYRMGRTDPEIAKICKVSNSAVYNWRRKNGLVSNRKAWGTK